ncbi:hypothetical protein HK098_002647 [Nowakowskiella sp. JEL0407]|nr:hypothetical protein HK098_002647 [Nowakowskiella sp. JEL0407]
MSVSKESPQERTNTSKANELLQAKSEQAIDSAQQLGSKTFESAKEPVAKTASDTSQNISETLTTLANSINRTGDEIAQTESLISQRIYGGSKDLADFVHGTAENVLTDKAHVSGIIEKEAGKIGGSVEGLKKDIEGQYNIQDLHPLTKTGMTRFKRFGREIHREDPAFPLDVASLDPFNSEV